MFVLTATFLSGLLLSDHRRRPFYAAEVKKYYICTAEAVTRNRVMWAHARLQGGETKLSMLNEDLQLVVEVYGLVVGFFSIGLLETSRVQSHMYSVDWHDALSSTASATTEERTLVVGKTAIGERAKLRAIDN